MGLSYRRVLFALLSLLLVIPATHARGANTSDPNAPDFDPVGGSIPGDDGGGSTSGGGAEGRDGRDVSVDGTTPERGQPGVSRQGQPGSSGVPEPPAKTTTTKTAPRSATTTRRSTTRTTRSAPSTTIGSTDDDLLPEESPSPSPSPTESPSPTPESSPSPFFSGAVEDQQRPTSEGSSILPAILVLLVLLGVFWVWSRRRRVKLRRSAHRLRS